jgi:hypothetical protein
MRAFRRSRQFKDECTKPGASRQFFFDRNSVGHQRSLAVLVASSGPWLARGRALHVVEVDSPVNSKNYPGGTRRPQGCSDAH